MSLVGLAAGGAALALGLWLAEPASAAIDGLAWRRRARALPRRGPALLARDSAAAPLLKAGGRASDAWLAPWLKGPAAALAVAGRASLSVVVLAAGVAALPLALLAHWAGVPALGALLLWPLLALGLVHLLAGALARRARAAFGRGFPDALAILIRALRAGLPVTVALAEVAHSGAGPVARAFAEVVEAMRLGAPVETALWRTAKRLGVADFDLLVITIALQRETGGNLAATLANLDETLRQRRLLALKIRAMAAEARASALIIGSMPFGMAALMAVVSPDYLAPLLTTGLGKAMIGAGLGSLFIGAMIISQLMRIEP
jgi:tight adherence protein B